MDANVSDSGGVRRKTQHRVQRGRPSGKHPQVLGALKQFPCEWPGCGKSFSRKSDLSRHDNTHTNTRNFRCNWDDCGKSFIQTSALTVHYRTHTGEKPHKCQICAKPFSDSSSMARHRKTHDNAKSFRCPKRSCAQSFPTKISLSRHQSKEHQPANSVSTTRKNQKKGRRKLQNLSDPDCGDITNKDGQHSDHSDSKTQTTNSNHPSIVVRSNDLTPTENQEESNWFLPGQAAAPSYWPQSPLHRPVISRVQHQYLPISDTNAENHYEAGPVAVSVCPQHEYLEQDNPINVHSALAYGYPLDYQNSVVTSPVVLQSGYSFYENPHISTYQPAYIRVHDNSIVQDVPINPSQDESIPAVPQLHTEYSNVEGCAIEDDSSSQVPNNSSFGSVADQFYPAQHLMSVTDQQYHLPGMILSLGIVDEDKLIDEFGEPLPSQVSMGQLS